MIRGFESSGLYEPRTHTRTRERSRKSLSCNDLGLWTRTVRPNQFRTGSGKLGQFGWCQSAQGYASLCIRSLPKSVLLPIILIIRNTIWLRYAVPVYAQGAIQRMWAMHRISMHIRWDFMQRVGVDLGVRSKKLTPGKK